MDLQEWVSTAIMADRPVMVQNSWSEIEYSFDNWSVTYRANSEIYLGMKNTLLFMLPLPHFVTH